MVQYGIISQSHPPDIFHDINYVVASANKMTLNNGGMLAL